MRFGEGWYDLVRQHGDPILRALSAADRQGTQLEIHILDAESQGLEQSQPRAVEECGHERVRSLQVAKERRHLVAREHDRQAGGSFRPFDVFHEREVDLQDVAVEEEHRAERLCVRCRSHATLDGQVREESPDLGDTHLRRVFQAVEVHEPAGPVHVRLLRPAAVVARPDGGADAVEQAVFLHVGPAEGCASRTDGIC